MIIKDHSGNTRYNLQQFEVGSAIHRELMKEHYIKLPFTTSSIVSFQVGDYCDVDGFGRFILTKPYLPKYNTRTLGYDYVLQMDADYMKWKDKIVKYKPNSGASETSFHLTSNISVHLGVIIAGINSLGAKDSMFKYNGTTDYDFVLVGMSSDAQAESKYKYYQNTDYISALNDLASIYECEWWVEENHIKFGRCEVGTSVDFTIDSNVSEISGSDSSKEYATRLYAFGSTRNLHQNYRRSLNNPFTIGYFGKIWSNKVRITCPKPPNNSWYESLQSPNAYKLVLIDSTTNSIYDGLTVPFTVVEGVYVPLDAANYYRVEVGWDSPVFEIDLSYLEGNSNGFHSGMKVSFLPSLKGSTVPPAQTLYETSQVTISTWERDSFYAIAFSDFEINKEAINSNTKITAVSNSVEYLGYLNDISGNALNQGKKLYGVVPLSSSLPSYITVGTSTASITGLSMAYVSRAYTHPDYSSDSSDSSDDEITQGSVVEKRLMLPLSSCPYGYVQDGVNTESDAIESVIVNEDIYPKATFTVSDVKSYPKTNDEGETQTFYQVYPSSGDLVLTEEMRLEGLKLHIIFQSGAMNGMEFECEPNFTNGYYEVLFNEDYGRPLPDVSLHPSVGDTFVLTGWDASLSTGLVAAAEAELYAYATEVLAMLKKDAQNYTCKMMSWQYEQDMLNNGSYDHYPIGQKVKLVDSSRFGSSGRSSRIIGYDIKLDIPYDEPTYLVGEAGNYSRYSDLQNQIDGLKYSGGSYKSITGGSGSVGTGGGSSSVNIVQTTGTSEEDVMSQKAVTQTVNNVYNAMGDYDEVAYGNLKSATLCKTYKFILEDSATTYHFSATYNGETFSVNDISSIEFASDLEDAIAGATGFSDFASAARMTVSGTTSFVEVDGEDEEVEKEVLTVVVWSGTGSTDIATVSLTKGVSHTNATTPTGYPKTNDNTGDKEFCVLGREGVFINEKRKVGVLYIAYPESPSTDYTLWTWNGTAYVPLGSNVEVDTTPQQNGGNAISSGWAYTAEQAIAGKVDKVLATFEFSNLIGTSSNQDFYFATLKPTDYYKPVRVRYKIDVNVPTNTNYVASSFVDVTIVRSAVNTYAIYNAIYSTSYRPYYYHLVYLATSAGATDYGHLLGFSLRSSKNPTSSSYKRSGKITILEVEGGTLQLLDSLTAYADAQGTGDTNYSELTELNGYSKGLQETGDTNTTYTNASLGQGYGTCSTAASTAAKEVTLASYALTLGGIVSVKFEYDVPANATMSINGKDAKAIYYHNAAITDGIIKGGDVATFIYSTYYHLISIDRGTGGGVECPILEPSGSITIGSDTFTGSDLFLENFPTNTSTSPTATLTSEDMSSLGFTADILDGIISKKYLRIQELYDGDYEEDYRTYEVCNVYTAPKETDYEITNYRKWFTLRWDTYKEWQFYGEGEGDEDDTWTVTFFNGITTNIVQNGQAAVKGGAIYTALANKANTAALNSATGRITTLENNTANMVTDDYRTAGASGQKTLVVYNTTAKHVTKAAGAGSTTRPIYINSNGEATPMNELNPTLSAGSTDANKVKMTVAGVSSPEVTVPFATKAAQDDQGNEIKATYLKTNDADGKFVKYNAAQTINADGKAQARANIDSENLVVGYYTSGFTTNIYFTELDGGSPRNGTVQVQNGNLPVLIIDYTNKDGNQVLTYVAECINELNGYTATANLVTGTNAYHAVITITGTGTPINNIVFRSGFTQYVYNIETTGAAQGFYADANYSVLVTNTYVARKLYLDLGTNQLYCGNENELQSVAGSPVVNASYDSTNEELTLTFLGDKSVVIPFAMPILSAGKGIDITGNTIAQNYVVCTETELNEYLAQNYDDGIIRYVYEES